MTTENRFSDEFANYACIGDTITAEVDGFDVTARIEFDQNYGIDDDDCHSTDQSVCGCNDEQFAGLLKARKAWFNDEWQYVGLVLSVAKNGVTLDDHAASLWGMELNYPVRLLRRSSGHCPRIRGHNWLDEAIEAGKATIERLLADRVAS